MVTSVSGNILHVYMNDLLVGVLEKRRNGILSFTYAQTWLQMSGTRPLSLSLPLVKSTYTGQVVYDFFDNLLPDNPFIRARIRSRFQLKHDEPFELLRYIGQDCVGAIQLQEPHAARLVSKTMQFHALKPKNIADLLLNIQTHPLGMSAEEDAFRISIAGAQEKTALLYWKNQWMLPLGTTPTTHIFKLPIGYIQHQHLDLSDSCENEWLCAKIIAAFGLPIANCEIHEFEQVKSLVVERFDRKLSRDKTKVLRLPQEDMCQALGVAPHLKYQADGGPGIKDIMDLLLGSATPMKDRDIFFTAQIIFVLLAAIDGHAKNFSIAMGTHNQFRLTPLYDVISAYPLIANKQLQAKKIKMAMALKGKNNHYLWYSIQRRHFLDTAKISHYPVARAEQKLNEVLDKVDDVIERVATKLPKKFPAKISQPIFAGMKQTKMRLQSSSIKKISGSE